MDIPNDFVNEQKVTPAPLVVVARGSAPCIEIFVFDELKINSFRPFLVKISLKFTQKIPRKNG